MEPIQDDIETVAWLDDIERHLDDPDWDGISDRSVRRLLTSHRALEAERDSLKASIGVSILNELKAERARLIQALEQIVSESRVSWGQYARHDPDPRRLASIAREALTKTTEEE